jgi:hypothetical protein
MTDELSPEEMSCIMGRIWSENDKQKLRKKLTKKGVGLVDR